MLISLIRSAREDQFLSLISLVFLAEKKGQFLDIKKRLKSSVFRQKKEPIFFETFFPQIRVFIHKGDRILYNLLVINNLNALTSCCFLLITIFTLSRQGKYLLLSEQAYTLNIKRFTSSFPSVVF